MNHLVALLPTRGQVASIRTALVEFSFLRWAALPISDRRWTAPLSATAVGLGLFIGVGMSPGLNPSRGAIVQVPEALASSDTSDAGEAGADAPVPALGSPVASVTAPAAPGPVPGSSAPPPTTAPAPPPPSAPASPSTTTTTPTTTTTTEEAPTTPAEETEEAIVLKGTVIHVNPAAHSYGLTTGKGQLSAVHAKKLPDVGRKLEVEVRELANGTYAEHGKERLRGRATTAKFQGLVTYVDPLDGDYTVSRRGASILVRLDPATDAEAPTVGSLLTVGVEIAKVEVTAEAPIEPQPIEPQPIEPDPSPEPGEPPAKRAAPLIEIGPVTPPVLPDGCGARPPAPEAPETTLVERSRDGGSEFLGYSDFAGVVQGVCPEDGLLILGADDIGESGADLSFAVAEDAGIDLGVIQPGDVVNASATIDEGSLELDLTGISYEGGIDQADDATLTQGDQAG